MYEEELRSSFWWLFTNFHKLFMQFRCDFCWFFFSSRPLWFVKTKTSAVFRSEQKEELKTADFALRWISWQFRRAFPRLPVCVRKRDRFSFFLLSIPQGGYRSSTGWWFNPCLLSLLSACLNAFGQDTEPRVSLWSVSIRKYLGVEESSLVLMWSRKIL